MSNNLSFFYRIINGSWFFRYDHNDNIFLFNVKYNTSSYNENYNIDNKFRQNPRRYVYSFDCKMPFTFNNGTILPHVDYVATVNLDFVLILFLKSCSDGKSFTSEDGACHY